MDILERYKTFCHAEEEGKPRLSAFAIAYGDKPVQAVTEDVKTLLEENAKLRESHRLLALIVNDADRNGWRSENVETAREYLGWQTP